MVLRTQRRREFVFSPDSGYVTGAFLSTYEMESIRGIPGLARKLIVEQE